MSTTAFLSATAFAGPRRPHVFSSTCGSFSAPAVSASGAARSARMHMSAQQGEEQKEKETEKVVEGEEEEKEEAAGQSFGEDVIFDDEIEEPYPGFFGDMKRMGMSDEEARAQALKQMKQRNPVKSDKVGGKKNLFREDGTAYAPWMADFPTEYNNAVIKKRTDATGKLAADPQLGELSGSGLTYKKVGDDIELLWATGAENNNLGFVVYRRKGKSEKWEKIDDFRTNASLKTQGANGGKYAFLIEEPEAGTWVYRVSDVDQNENVCDLSQVLVEIESAEDSKVQKIALAALLAIFAIAFAIGLALDPQSL